MLWRKPATMAMYPAQYTLHVIAAGAELSGGAIDRVAETVHSKVLRPAIELQTAF